MNDKLKRLAKNVSELVHNDKETLQSTYDNLRTVMSNQRDYFSNFLPENIIKLTFYVWSYKNTGDFKVADKILNNIAFAVLFTTEGNTYEEECGQCDGNGIQSCSYCSGDGSIQCDECEGDGEVYCSACDGSGSISEDDGTLNDCDECDGKGKIECAVCDGSGENSCSECSGDGSEECDNCDGSGELQTGQLVYNVYNIVTWSKYFKDRCELTEQSMEITMSEYDFDRLRNDYIVLSNDEEHAELEEVIETNEMYCPLYSDSPKLYLQSKVMTIFFNYDMKPYFN
jgi:hypothetical protein